MTELYAKKCKIEQGTCMGVPIYGWGMKFYKDAECKNLEAIDPFHYIRKDKVMTLSGIRVLVHVVK